MYGAIGILAALHRVKDTGIGDYIDVSMLDCQAAMLGYQASYHLHSGAVPGRQGRGHDSIAAYGSFKAKDGVEVVIAAMTQRMWEQLCTTIGLAALIKDARFIDGAARNANRDELWPLLETAFLRQDANTWNTVLEDAGVPAGIVNTLDLVVSNPQIQHRGMIVELEAEDGRRVQAMGNPLLMQTTGRGKHSYPPHAGENTADILQELLDLPSDEIDQLVSSGIIHAAPKP